MNYSDSIKLLQEKADELRREIERTEATLAVPPQNDKSAAMRAMMEQLLEEMRRTEKNVRAIITREQNQQSEGGKENGSY